MDLIYKRLLSGFKKVIDERSLESMNKQLYSFFNSYCGFKELSNIHGFKQEYEGLHFIGFLRRFSNPASYLCNNPDFEKAECIRAMIEYAKENETDILFEIKNRIENEKIQKLRSLAKESGYDIVRQGSTEKEDPFFRF